MTIVGQQANVCHFECYFMQFQKIIVNNFFLLCGEEGIVSNSDLMPFELLL